jgi:hypothetical protein
MPWFIITALSHAQRTRNNSPFSANSVSFFTFAIFSFPLKKKIKAESQLCCPKKRKELQRRKKHVRFTLILLYSSLEHRHILVQVET